MNPDATFPRGTTALLVEDDVVLSRRLSSYLESRGLAVAIAKDLTEARRLLAVEHYDYALVDLHLPDGLGLTLLRERRFPETAIVVVMTAFGGIPEAVEAMRLGASDFLAKPFDLEAVPLVLLRSRNARHSERRDETRSRGGEGETELVFGESLGALRVQLDQMLVAERRAVGPLPPLMIEGETGTGKSMLARWVHRQGPRMGRPFVSINCAALPDQLAEAELFGHERGAFTDAKQARVGLFEAADGGTLFLDEVGSLSLQTQAKLLTAVEEGVVRRLGGTRTCSIDVRLIVASNTPVAELVQRGLFREDLYFRLHLLHVTLPPLRERGADVVELARQLLARTVARYRLGERTITAEGEARLLAQPWRGNVRELAHVIERAVILGTGKEIEFAELGAAVAGDGTAAWLNPKWRLPDDGFSIEAAIGTLIELALRETAGNLSAAARRLGVTREYIRYHRVAGSGVSPAAGPCA